MTTTKNAKTTRDHAMAARVVRYLASAEHHSRASGDDVVVPTLVADRRSPARRVWCLGASGWDPSVREVAVCVVVDHKGERLQNHDVFVRRESARWGWCVHSSHFSVARVNRWYGHEGSIVLEICGGDGEHSRPALLLASVFVES